MKMKGFVIAMTAMTVMFFLIIGAISANTNEESEGFQTNYLGLPAVGMVNSDSTVTFHVTGSTTVVVEPIDR